MTLDEAHGILGVPAAGLTFEKLRKRWHELALQHHPDRGGDAGTFALLNQAHQLVLPTVPEAAAPQACATCGGAHRVEVRRGFTAVWIDCPSCGDSR